jgi:beta-lactamase regulating signal transducer with metallopeptidase domain
MLAAPALTVAMLHDDPAAPTAVTSVPVEDEPAAPVMAIPTTEMPAVQLGWADAARSWIDPAIPWVLAVWLAGVCLLSLRLARGWVAARRVAERGCEPAAPRWQATLARLRRELGVSRPVRLAASALAQVPSVVGWLRPVVVVPVSAFAGLTTWQVEAVLAHELAHIRRHDYLVNLLQSAVETLLFYHPATWWVSRQVREERERCCDDVAVALCGDAAGYVRALAELEAMRAAPALAMSATGGSLLGRARRLLAPPQTRRSSGTLAGAIALVLVAGAWATASAEQSASFSSSAMAPMDPASVPSAMPHAAPPTSEGVVTPLSAPPVAAQRSAPPVVADAPAIPAPSAQPAPPLPAPSATAAPVVAPVPDSPVPEPLPVLAAPIPVIAPPSPPFPPVPPVSAAAFTPPVVAAPPRPPRAGRSDEDDGPDLIDVMAELGYRRIPVDQLIALGVHGITRSFVAGMNGLGFGRLPVETLIAMKIHGVTPGFARDLRAAGVTIRRAEELQRMRIHGVTPEIVREARQLGFRPLSPDRLVELRIHGLLPRRRSR